MRILQLNLKCYRTKKGSGISVKSAKIARKFLGSSDLAAVFNAIGNKQKNYNWVVTDHDLFTWEELLRRRFAWTGVFLSGDELTGLYIPRCRITFFSAVLSAYSKEIPVRELQQYPLPEWESRRYWRNKPALLNSRAVIELVFYDGYELLFLSRRDELVEAFLRAFPQAVDLAETNRKTNHMEHRITAIFHREAAARGISLTQEVEKLKYGVFQTLCLSDSEQEHYDASDREIVKEVRKLLDRL